MAQIFDEMAIGTLAAPIKNYQGYLGYPQTEEQKEALDKTQYLDSDQLSERTVYFEIKCAGLSYTLNDGYKIPVIALGTSLGHQPNGTRILPMNHTMSHTVQRVLEAGCRHIDTAFVYRTEGEVGLGIQTYLKDNRTVSRSDIFVTTKLWNDSHDYDDVIPALEKSLQRLRLDYVDLFLMHYPLAYTTSFGPIGGPLSGLTDYLETWKGMEKAKDEGLTRSIGVANFNLMQLNRLWQHARIKPAVLQIEVNPTMTNNELVEWCQNHGVVVMAYCPFGAILGRKSNRPPLRFNHPTMKRLCKKYKKSVSQILLRYLIDRNIIPITRSTRKTHIRRNLDIFDFQLTVREVDELSAFNANYRIKIPYKWYPHPYFPFEKQNFSELQIQHIINHSREL